MQVNSTLGLENGGYQEEKVEVAQNPEVFYLAFLFE